MRVGRYVHVWRIVDDTRPLSQLRDEALAAVDVLAGWAGARLVGDPTVTVAGDRLVLEAPAVPERQPELVTAVARLVWLRWPDRQIAEALGVPLERVRQVRQSRHLPEVVEEVAA